jgi:hypothetical protein
MNSRILSKQHFCGTSLQIRRAPTPNRAHAQVSRLIVRADRALIVNTKGGGHAFLGLHLAKKLLADGHKITVLNDGDEVCM